MIAVIGCIKETVKVKMRMPSDDSQQADMGGAGFGAPVNTMQEDDDIAVKDSGCGFNIAANLAGCGYETEFISVIGEDTLGAAAKSALNDAGVKTGGVKIFPGGTVVEVEFINVLGDVEMCRSNRAAMKNITPEFLKESAHILEKAEAIVMDGTIPQETIEYVMKTYGNTKVFFDPSCVSGAYKVCENMPAFDCVMPGRMEAEAMTGKSVLSEEELAKAGAYFESKGIKRSIITIKGGGLYYKEGDEEGILRPERVITFGSTSGAGDVVSAAVVAGTLEGKSIQDIAKDAMDKAAEYLACVKDEKSI